MIKRNNKKGFTIVELVIVIAVIAILAAVLIPTFAGIIKKAQLSSDQQAVRNMNVALAASGDLEGINAAVDALSENGFNAADTLVPVSKGYAFYWFETANTVLLVEMNEDETPKAVVYPDDETLAADFMAASDDVRHNLKGAVKYLNAEVKDVADLAEAFANGQIDIKLDADVNITSALIVPANAEIELNLNGKKLTTDTYMDGANEKHRYVEVYGTLTIADGEFEGRGVWAKNGGELIIKDAKVSAVDPNGGAAINVEAGAKVTVDGGEFYATAAASATNGGSVIMNQGGELTINGGKFESTVAGPYVVNHMAGTTVINGGEFKGCRGMICSIKGTVTVNGGTFTLAEGSEAYIAYVEAGSIVINAGTLSGGKQTTYVTAGKGGSITIKKGVTVDGTAFAEDKTYN